MRPVVAVTTDSVALQDELEQLTLGDRRVARDSARLVHDLQLAGGMASLPARRQLLARHLRYWQAVRQIVVPAHERRNVDTAADIEPFNPSKATLDPADFLDRASGTVGACQVDVHDARISGGEVDRFVVDGSRVIGARVVGLRARRLSLQETGVFHSRIVDVDVERFDARYCGLVDTTIAGVVSDEADLSDAAARQVKIGLQVAGRACFDDADLSNGDNDNLVENLRGIQGWDRREATVLFDGLQCGSTSFAGTKLDGAVFQGCNFGHSLDVTGARLAGTRFSQCRVSGRALKKDDLVAAAEFTSLSDSVQVLD